MAEEQKQDRVQVATAEVAAPELSEEALRAVCELKRLNESGADNVSYTGDAGVAGSLFEGVVKVNGTTYSGEKLAGVSCKR